MTIADHDPRLTRGLLNMQDASRLLGIPRQTFHRWARGYERGGALIHVLDVHQRRHARVTFIGATEAWVLEALRQAGVRPGKIRPALERLQQEFGRDYVLTAPELVTDGIDVLWDFSQTKAGAGLIEGSSGQRVMRSIVDDYLQYVRRDGQGTPDQLELRSLLPAKVVMDVDHAFGQPRFAGSNVRVADVAAMLAAGEDTGAVADEYGISANDVNAAARVLLGRAA